MAGQTGHDDRDHQRQLFVRNREKVRAWQSDWECPEIEWPPFREVPGPWLVGEGEEQVWFERHAAGMDQYDWLLEARPISESIREVWAHWSFGPGHAFREFVVTIESVPDPTYLAEALALAAHAARLGEGWRDDDARALHTWLFEGLDRRPLGNGVHGQTRVEFILFDFVRDPLPTGVFSVRLRATPTTTALDGSPLDDHGRTRP